MARIALDAMGGDHAPRAPIAGALHALGEVDPAHRIQLVGRSAAIEEELGRLLAGEFSGLSAARDRLEIIDAPDVVEMSDKATAAIRQKPNSSMAVGLRMHAHGESQAFVSAGNTGAQMAASAVLLKLYDGLTRPAIATVFPTARKQVVVLDSGANVDCTAKELVQFARLGVVYAEDILGRANPGVGLLSIGEEPEKGNSAVKEAHQLLKTEDILFVGNIEGRDILAGSVNGKSLDVVVCDGFVGNVLLKFYESVAPLMMRLLVQAGVERDHLERAFKAFDYSETGGAPLLGVRGISIISHGSSSPRAIKNAIKVAVRALESGLVEHVGRKLQKSAPGSNAVAS